jgi:hypothetical protein
MTLKEAERVIADGLRRYQSGEESGRTEALRAVASATIAAREHFSTPDGEIDWRGRSHAYRRWVRSAMSGAGVTETSLPTLQAAIRYHAGTILRDRLSPEKLVELGLRAEGPRDRKSEYRDRVAHSLDLLAGGGPLTSLRDLLDSTEAMRTMLGRFSEEAVAGLAPEEKKRLHDLLRDVYTRSKQLADATK